MQSIPRPPIIKSGVRILRPLEFESLRTASPFFGQTWENVALDTGMRYVELQRFQDSPNWFDRIGGFVSLPQQAILKAKRKQLERWVKLNERGRGSVASFLEGKRLPTTQGFGMDLKRWASLAGIETRGLGPKTFRKTAESWLVATYPSRLTEILLRQGHTAITSVGHYLNMPFTLEEKEQIKPYVDGMF